jgi:hypothetical protein
MRTEVINGRLKVNLDDLSSNTDARMYRAYWIVKTDLAFSVYSSDGWYSGSHYDPERYIDRQLEQREE